MKTAFFRNELENILAAKEGIYPSDLVRAAEAFAAACRGAADGEMDIEFQETGRGYYAHLHELSALEEKDPEAHLSYRSQLLEELEEAVANGDLSHQMQVVKDSLDKSR